MLPLQEEPVVKQGRGRPRKISEEIDIREKDVQYTDPKRGRGRPRKILEFDNNLNENKPNNLQETKFREIEEFNPFLLDEDVGASSALPEEKKEPVIEIPEIVEEPVIEVQEEEYVPQTVSNIELTDALSEEQKIVTFVGSTKNGSSFLVNNVAMYLSSRGVKTAILDLTGNKNSYYIYTKNDDNLRSVAVQSTERLRRGMNSGINVNKNLTVFTGLPGENKEIHDTQRILTTLAQNFKVVLIDADFNTPDDYFARSNEIYLVQSLDILTIQPFTDFLRKLKSKGILNNVRVVINKYLRSKSITPKVLIGGLAFYKDPSMTFMTELFDRNNVVSMVVPFNEQNYIKYIECIVDCEITLDGYTKDFMAAIKDLSEYIYPINKMNSKKPKFNKVSSEKEKTKFSPGISNTLEQMKNNY